MCPFLVYIHNMCAFYLEFNNVRFLTLSFKLEKERIHKFMLKKHILKLYLKIAQNEFKLKKRMLLNLS